MSKFPGARRVTVATITALLMSFFASAFITTTPARADAATSDVVGIATKPSNNGYWVTTPTGAVKASGTAAFLGDLRMHRLNRPVTGMTSTPSGEGYWLVASDGGIFAFGDARFFGSTGAMKLNKPVVGMAATPSGSGYWLVASDGGIFAFGDATFRGAATESSAAVFGMTTDGRGGYSLLRNDGAVLQRLAPVVPVSPVITTPTTTVPTTAPPTTTTTTVALPVVPPVVTTAPPTTTTTTPVVSPPVSASSNPFASGQLWVDPSNPAKAQANAWRTSRPNDAATMDRMGASAAAVWIGEWSGDVRATVDSVTSAAAQTSTVPVLVAYNIPGRDCGLYSAGGAHGSDAYKAWIRSFAEGIGNKTAAVILEPDALSQLDCLNDSGQQDRLALLRDAVSVLESRPNTAVYIDAGHPGWHSAATMAQRLTDAGVQNARGFSLNVSNYTTTTSNVTYGVDLSNRLNGAHFVVDTSRNGNGSNGEWCNPAGRALGAEPTANTGIAQADAFLWIKRPGESDGSCNGGPGAGQWWADYALGLARSAWD